MKQNILNPYVFLEGLKKDGQQFKIRKTLFTMEIDCDYGEFKWISKESNLPKNELFFIKMVKDDVKSFDLSLIPEINTNEIKYFNIPEQNFDLENCIEIDITSAYWELSKIFLSEKVWQRGLTVDKKTRLASLGGLAKTITEQIWNGKEFVTLPTETIKTKNLFFYCAKETGEIIDSMRMVADSFLFSWVDAIFISNENDLKYIEAVLNIKNLKCKKYKCERIVSDENKITVYSSEHKKKERDFLKERISSNFFIGRFKDRLLNKI